MNSNDWQDAQHADQLVMQQEVLNSLIFLHHMASQHSMNERMKAKTDTAAREVAAALGLSKEFEGEDNGRA